MLAKGPIFQFHLHTSSLSLEANVLRGSLGSLQSRGTLPSLASTAFAGHLVASPALSRVQYTQKARLAQPLPLQWTHLVWSILGASHPLWSHHNVSSDLAQLPAKKGLCAQLLVPHPLLKESGETFSPQSLGAWAASHQLGI